MIEKTPSMALSVRFKHRSESSAKNDIRHDLRRGPQPKYIDAFRSDHNSTIIKPVSPSILRDICAERRELVDTERKAKSNHSVASSFVITFGAGLQRHVEDLSYDLQDALYRAVAEAVTDHIGIELTGLVAHRDETAPHAHGQCPARHQDGRPMGKAITQAIASEIQTIAMQAAAPFLPMIKRGKPKADRIADGEDQSAIYNRSVRQLHEDLPREEAQLKDRISNLGSLIEAKEEQLIEATLRVSEMQKRVDKLQNKIDDGEALTAAEEKRLATYQKRLDDRNAELDRFQKELERYRDDSKRDQDNLDEGWTQLSAREEQLIEKEAKFAEAVSTMKSVMNYMAEELGLTLPRKISAGIKTLLEAVTSMVAAKGEKPFSASSQNPTDDADRPGF
jgi:predicted  nucleic acid-binding Zn-ribbon protein